MKKRNAGFTLVEILSILTVLGIIVMLVLPNLGGNIDERKENELNKLIGIIENSAKVYHSFNSDVYKIKVSDLIEEKYISTDMTNPKTGEKLGGCVNVVLDENDTYSYIYGSCDGVEVPFSVELGIGTQKQTFNEKYLSSTKIELVNPTSEKGDFKGWEIVKGNSILKGNTLIIGTIETILFAVWEKYGKLDVDYDGGTPGTELKPYYKTGEIIELLPPTKEGYIFTGWTSTGGSLSGNAFTMGNSDAVLTATWKETAATYISLLCGDSSSCEANKLKVDEAGNLRYVGSGPSNYVYFNCAETDSNGRSYGVDVYNYASSCEVWRIVGIFDIVNAGTNTNEKMIKLVRNASLLNVSWDSSVSTINGGLGVNEWSQSDLKEMLNTYYLGATTSCLYCNASKQASCAKDCTSSIKPLNILFRNMVETVVWNTGALQYKEVMNLYDSYNQERSNQDGKTLCTNANGASYSYCNDKVDRYSTWEGMIGLIYPSDYGYASADSNCAKDIYNSNSTCEKNNWLHPSSGQYWTITPSAYQSSSRGVWIVYNDISMNNYNASEVRGVRPSLYVKASVKIIDGTGLSSKPYVLK